ncbi:MAG: membrane protein [Gemmatimonadota bacterium]|nr:MAG: membrane protein [Gemmatimonadota bacterium]
MRTDGMGAKVLIVVLAATILVAPGCYGPFKLTKGLHEWNEDVGDGEKWVSELVFLGLIILPVYGLATLGDAIIFNSIEFWTGDNPIDGSVSTVLEDGDKLVYLDRDGEQVSVRVCDNDQLIDSSQLVTHDDGRTCRYDADGNLLATATVGADGSVIITNADGSRRVITQDQLDALMTK